MPNYTHESRQESQKSLRERMAFREFSERSHLAIDSNSIEKREAREPDILCYINGEGHVAFELKELCAPEIAEQISYYMKCKSEKPQAVWTADPTERILRSALKKSLNGIYKSVYPIELLLYNGGRVVTPADVVIPVILGVLKDTSHQFRRIWYMGLSDETCECVFP